MAQTYAQYVADVKKGIAEQAYGEELTQDIALYFDIAASHLFFPDFKALAQKRFPMCNTERTLIEAVAHTLY